MEHRVEFDFEVTFTNGGGIQGQGFRLDIPGDDVTVLIEAGENGVVPLTEELERYWAEVELVAGRPAWLGAP